MRCDAVCPNFGAPRGMAVHRHSHIFNEFCAERLSAPDDFVGSLDSAPQRFYAVTSKNLTEMHLQSSAVNRCAKSDQVRRSCPAEIVG